MPSRRTVLVSVVLAFPLLLVFLNLRTVSQQTSSRQPARLRRAGEQRNRTRATRDFVAGVLSTLGGDAEDDGDDAVAESLDAASADVAERLVADQQSGETSRHAAAALAVEAEKRESEKVEVAATATTRREASRHAATERPIPELTVCAHVDTYSRVAHAKKGDHDPLEHGNASLCVAPMIQLKEKLKVRLVPKGESGGKRAFFLMTQGLRQHPMVELVGGSPRFCADRGYQLDKASPCEKDIAQIGAYQAEADVAIMLMPANDPKFYSSGKILAYSPYRWGNNKKLAADPVANVGTVAGYETIAHADENPTLFRYAPPVPANRMIFVDEADWSSSRATSATTASYLAYFKRSWVQKDGKASPVRAAGQRHKKSKSYFPMPYSLADEYVDSAKLGDVVGERPIDVVCTLRDTRGGRGRAKVVVTCNPTGWEGDFRLFEALSSGALVMVDRMGTPYHHPLIDGEHVVFYDHTNKTDLLEKLDHALKRPHWARKVGVKGYAHVLRHHRAVSWVDYFLRTAHAKMLAERGVVADYVKTGQAILARTELPDADGSVNRDFVTKHEHGALHYAAAELLDDDTLALADI
ncbi:hypothetical protein JL721_5627 [Aureococcus anophagefferens]|nr:hypothetical protein JL721_5627 [Aureococcus anophagefferens]